MIFPELKELNTPRLHLRKLTMADAPLYYARITSRPEICQYMLWEPHTDLSQTEAVIQKIHSRYACGCCYRWCIALAEDDSPIGSIELLRFEETESTCSFAYMISADHWGMGYGTEALQAVMRFAFEAMQIKEIIVDHMAANPASGAVMRKAGMTFLRHIPKKYEKSGKRMDAEEYCITREQWKSQQ